MQGFKSILDSIPEAGLPPTPKSFQLSLSGDGYDSIDPLNYFDNIQQIETSRGSFQTFTGGKLTNMLYLFIHGAGYSSLSFAEVIKVLKKEAFCMAIDLRSHGKSTQAPLDFDEIVLDINEVVDQFLGDKNQVPLVVLGHSLGGSLATAVNPQKCSLKSIILIDISENVALQSLPNMSVYLRKKPMQVQSANSYAEWLIKTNQLSRKQSACIQAQNLVQDQKVITDLRNTEQYWNGWFKGMNQRWMADQQVWKMLLVSSMNKLDRDFEIAHMQGKMNVEVVRNCIHNLHEDNPVDFLNIVSRFLRRLHLTDLLYNREFDFKKPMPEDEKEIPLEELEAIFK